MWARHEEEHQALLAAHRTLIDQIRPLFAAYGTQAAAFDEAVRADLEAELDAVRDELPAFPEAESAGDDEPESLFYHSGRSCWDQLQAFKAKLIAVHGLEGGQAEAALLTRSEKKRINRVARRA